MKQAISKLNALNSTSEVGLIPDLEDLRVAEADTAEEAGVLVDWVEVDANAEGERRTL